MKIQIVSDLHLESPKAYTGDGPFEILPRAPYLALLGDIGYAVEHKDEYLAFLETQLYKFKAVLLVPGNHESYKSTWPETVSVLQEFEEDVRRRREAQAQGRAAAAASTSNTTRTETEQHIYETFQAEGISEGNAKAENPATTKDENSSIHKSKTPAGNPLSAGGAVAASSSEEGAAGGQDELGEFIFLNRTLYSPSSHHHEENEIAILGCPLFSSIPASSADEISYRLTDFYPKMGTSNWNVSSHNTAHEKDLAWLNSTVSALETNHRIKKVVILTHWTPTRDKRAADPAHFVDGKGRPKENLLEEGFSTDLSSEICFTSEKVRLWAFGHTHWNCDFVVERDFKTAGSVDAGGAKNLKGLSSLMVKRVVGKLLGKDPKGKDDGGIKVPKKEREEGETENEEERKVEPLRLLANQRGNYFRQAAGFDVGKVVEV